MQLSYYPSLDGTLGLKGDSGVSDLTYSSGTLTIDTTVGYWIHSGGDHGDGLIQSHDDNGITYKTCTFTFNSISLTGSVNLVLKGDNSLVLKTQSNGNVVIGIDINLDGDDWTYDNSDARKGTVNPILNNYRNWIGLGKIGGKNGIQSGNFVGIGPGAGNYRVEGTTENDGYKWKGGGGGYGSAGQYASTGFGQPYGSPTLAHLHGGSSGGGGQWTGSGAGGGALSLEAHGDGNLTILSGVTISANGGITSERDNDRQGGGGSGGSLRFAGNNITNNGTISATGGTDIKIATGGGGRVAFNFKNNLSKGTVLVGSGAFAGTVSENTTPVLINPGVVSVQYNNLNYQAAATRANDLKLWYKFDESSGTTATDSSGNGRHGSVKNRTDGDWVPGVLGNALKFDYSGSVWSSLDSGPYVDMGSNWTIGGSMSFSAWLYIDQPMNNLRILDMAVGHDNENIMIGPIGTTTRMYAWWLDDTAGGREEHHQDNAAEYAQWFHFSATIDGGGTNGARMKVYKNGAFVGQSGTDKSPPDNITRGQQWLGRGAYQWSPYFKGKMDDVRFYQGELTASEVSSIYAETAPPVAATIGSLYGPTAFTATGLPTGLSIDSEGKIKGRASAIGDHNVTVGASNLSGAANPQVITIRVTPNVPVFLDDGNASNNMSTVGRNSAVGSYNLADTGGANPSIKVFYGSSDANFTEASWDSNVSLAGTHASGSVTFSLNNLGAGTTYYARLKGTNSAGSGWSDAFTFTTTSTVSPPAVITKPATSVATTSVTVNGEVLSYDGATSDRPTVTLYYDTTDRGATDSGWAANASLGAKSLGAFTHNLSSLTAGTRYFFRFKAVNSVSGTSYTSYSNVGDFVTIGTPVVNVTGASDVTPTSVTLNASITSTGGVTYQGGAPFSSTTVPGLLMWMDANDHNGDGTADTSEADITSWSDKSGNTRHLDGVQGDPRFIPNTLNGLGVVDFDNTGGINGRDILWQTDNAKSLYDHTAKFSVFAVSRYTGTDSEIVIGNADNWNWYFAGQGQYYNRVAHFNGWIHNTDNSVPQDDNNWHLYEATISDQDRGNCWLDGQVRGVNRDGAHNTNYRPKRIQFSGKRRADGQKNDQQSQCQIAEFIVVNRVVSETERIKIQGYLARKWGLMSTMFSGSHPYYSTDPYQPTITQGGEDATVTFYWGDNNASTNAGSWDNNAQISGTHGVGVVSKALTGLTKGTTYYYTTKVNNSGGNVWGTVKSFVPANTALGKNTVPDLALWLDATDVDGDGASDSLTDGSSVSAWTDKSNASQTVNQGSTGFRPVYKTSVFGTKSGIRFDGSDDFLVSTPVRTSAGGYPVFAVSQRANSGTGDAGAYLIKEAGWNAVASAGTGSYAPYVAKQSADSGATLTNLKIGRDTASGTTDFGGDMGEILIFTRKLGLSEEQKVEGYLAHKWGGTGALPASHPYKEVAPVFDNSPKLTPVIGQVGYDVVTRNGLLGEWLFDDNDTTSTIVDTSGNNYNGTNVNGVFSADTPRGTGTSLDFSGGNNYAWVSAGTNETTLSFDQTGDAFTVALWTKRLPQYDWRGLVVKNGENTGGWKLVKKQLRKSLSVH